MADFRTHITVAALGGVVSAAAGWALGWWASGQAPMVLALVAFGGILPDIDADRSRSNRVIFMLLSVPALVLSVLLLQSRLTPGELLLSCGGVHLGVRFVASRLFSRLTVHRGVWHSLLAATVCAMAIAAVSFQLLNQTAWLAWCFGAALWLGFIIHLLLDEAFSVDLEGARLKRSFGTAFKLADGRRPLASLLMLGTAVALLPWVPPFEVLVSLLTQGSLLWR